jgi:hypothetical protein
VVVAALDEQVAAELQPLAHEIALALIPQELSSFAANLNGSFSSHQLPEATNGKPATPDPPPSAEPQTRRCSHCRQTKPSSEFSPGHYVCKPCRREEWRRKQRQAAQSESEDEPGGLPG